MSAVRGRYCLLRSCPCVKQYVCVCMCCIWKALICSASYSHCISGLFNQHLAPLVLEHLRQKTHFPFSLLPLSLMPFLKLRLPHPALQQIKVLSCHLKHLTLLVQNNVRTAAEKNKHTQKIARVYRSACKCKTKLKIAGLIAIPDR